MAAPHAVVPPIANPSVNELQTCICCDSLLGGYAFRVYLPLAVTINLVGGGEGRVPLSNLGRPI